MAVDLEAERVALTGAVCAHSALLTTLITVLRQSGALTQVDVNLIVDCALMGAENVDTTIHDPDVQAVVRRQLEGFAETLGGSPSAAV